MDDGEKGTRSGGDRREGWLRRAISTASELGPVRQGRMPPALPDDAQHAAGLRTRVVVTAVIALLAILCAWPLADRLSSPDAYGDTAQTLDEQKGDALGLVATTTTASVAITAIPGDVGTPIADQLADLSGKLATVLAIIYLEKFLLTTFGLVACRFLVPAGLVLMAVWLWLRERWGSSRILFVWGVKLIVVAVALVTLVPVSTGITKTINEQYEASLAEETSQKADETNAATSEQSGNEDADEGKSPLEALGDAISSGADALASGAEAAVAAVGEQLNGLIDAVAVRIVTSCLVPLVVLLLYAWVIKLFTGADLTGYLSMAQGAAGAAVRQAGTTARFAAERHRASGSK